jgi:FkbM family methyltransferase
MSKRIKFRNRNFEIFMRDSADESVVAEIFDWQEYRSAEEAITGTSLPILDAGAHIGIFTLYAKAINPSAKIFALEPEPENFAFLKRNLKVNKIKDVKIFEIALAGNMGKRDLVLEDDSIKHHLLQIGEEKNENAKYAMVRSYSLEGFLLENNIKAVGLLKMDIEGGEYEIIENLSAGGFGKVQNMILEYHNYDERNYKELENILRRNGFSVQIFPSGFEKNLGFMLARNKRIGK